MKVMDILYKYREAFSLRDERGTCPDIEVELVREEDKAFIDKEMKNYVTWVF